MASFVREHALPTLQVVDLSRVRPHELEGLWEREVRLWRDVLGWDVSSAILALRRAVERGGLTGKAIRCGGSVVAYSYYVVENDRGVISSLVVSPAFRGPEVGVALVNAVIEELERCRVRRIETQFVCFDAPWLPTVFEGHRFLTHWRDFLKMRVSRPRPRPPASDVVILPWTAWNVSEMASLMHDAHRGGVDAVMNELYRSRDGCRVLLNNIIRQRGCGRALAQVSAVARERASDAPCGFAVVTEIGAGHGHLAQVAVAPLFQGRGVGQRLMQHSLSALGELGMHTLSLMVSRGNDRALDLYRATGFEPTYQFPVFSREL